MLKRLLVGVMLSLSVACSDPKVEAVGSPTPKPRPLPARSCSSREVDPVFFVGQEIFITDDGFKPKQLISISGEKITWVNETEAKHRIRFVNLEFAPGEMESPEIPPGGQATYTPGGAWSIVYQLEDDEKTKGSIQAEAYFEPGEDPAAPDRFDADSPEPGCRGPQPQ